VLDLAETLPFARSIVNSGRLSVPCTYDGSRLNGADDAALPPRSRPGSPCPDAPLGDGWLLNKLGAGFTLMTIDAAGEDVAAHGLKVAHLSLSAKTNEALRTRYLGDAPAAVYLIRPDQHVAARWQTYDASKVKAALARAIGLEN
jgi:3-(3-hydroxy-phenyl)propionate hydroxylase